MNVTLLYTGHLLYSDSPTVPVLRMFVGGEYVNAADTCLPPHGPGAWSEFDPATGLFSVAICHFSLYALFSHIAPVAVLTGPPYVQAPHGASGPSSAPAVFNSSDSYDPDLAGPVTCALCLVSGVNESAPGEAPPCSPLPSAGNGLWNVSNLAPGNHTLVLTVMDADGGLANTTRLVQVNTVPLVREWRGCRGEEGVGCTTTCTASFLAPRLQQHAPRDTLPRGTHPDLCHLPCRLR